MAGRKRPLRRFARRAERVLLGVVMSFAAFVIEKRVLKAIRSGSVKPAPETEPAGPGLAISPENVDNQP